MMLHTGELVAAKQRQLKGHSEFWTIWLENKEKLLSCCHRWLRNDGEKVEDVLALTCEKAFRAYSQSNYKIENEFAWLCRIAHNLCMDEHRAKAKHQDIVNHVSELPDHFFFADNQSASLESDHWNTSLYNKLVKEIAILPTDLRLVMQYKFLYEMEYAEIASRLQLSLENVRKRVQLARRQLISLKEEYKKYS
ncbi:sigma-70 family RNA polymerase sigma factor [Pseudoalteromonas sp. Of7M-16]|uniref:RNA polymerase sigma factor n=1 Tax=Pseudoalteromonas sp. Of7M-16 TaxID=2917756 RepID=UPI001EF545D2|nr:sigma-70 family RNA polymerase sigma factor [Pseudoalteromonas sp. Of7M-16]MCG7550409.1 sigma-70 family RNA polymerase sigma factor [Pseudoalteromonas sp. Of7M-16]